MKIEIAEPGRMTQTGSSLLKLIQNNNMPVLDLLVRESIQNSLDARKKDAKYVDVEYLTGKFQSNRLANELEGITDALNGMYNGDSAEYIAVKDSNTTGLTGEMNYKKIKDNQYGNLLKLVYEICKPQEAAGAGGSWGLGKTVYFRIGIGLVIYYSRIKNENGSFQSRLAASLVEKETSSDAMIPVYKDQAKRGIAWWGDAIGENITQPVTDDSYIKNFLDIFGIEPYVEENTGTVIIIPYIDSKKLLENNQIEYLTSSEQKITPYWCNSLEKYLSIAVQRWYAPRLSNSCYTNGAYLRLKINGKGLSVDSMEPIFKVIRSLYNRANNIVEDDILSNDGCIVKSEQITVTKYLDDPVIGNVAFAKVHRDILGMCAPSNKPEPYMYMNCEIRDAEANKPIVCFTRKPGMIVSYENIGAWTTGISSSVKDEYIIGLFVLNSWNSLKNDHEEGSLEEYIRRSEMADHTSWSDWSEGSFNPRLVIKIQNKVSKAIGREFRSEEEESITRKNSGLGKMFGDMLLPPEGFGKRAGGGGTSRTSPHSTSVKRGILFDIDRKGIQYSQGKMLLPIVLKTSGKRKISFASYKMIIDSDSQKIELSEWEEKMSMNAPFRINSIDINVKRYEGQQLDSVLSLNQDKSLNFNLITFKRKTTKAGSCYGIELETEEPVSIELLIKAHVDIIRNDIKPAFLFEKEVQ